MRQQAAVEAIASRRGAEFEREIDGELGADERLTIAELASRPSAADPRLEEATALLQAAERREAAARVRAADKQGREAAANALKDSLTEYSSLLYDGLPDEAAETFVKILTEQQRSDTPVDIGEIAAAVKRDLRIETAMKEFAKTYPEIFGDPHLAKLGDSYFAAAIAAGKSEAAALTEAGESTRAYVKNQASKLGMRERGARAERESASDEPNPSSIIAEMGAGRICALVDAERERQGRGE